MMLMEVIASTIPKAPFRYEKTIHPTKQHDKKTSLYYKNKD